MFVATGKGCPYSPFDEAIAGAFRGGSNVVCGLTAQRIEEAAAVMTALPASWQCPEGYLAGDVSDKVVKFVLGGKWNVY
ncbi:hypothetical protein [Paenibacillus sp. R14(2021)]|uniref:hypothetical protein n=1 Tax=Paenibacillus sp. R14(2021) TaxID=2859228 RepID=UPI001C61309A